MLDLLVLADEIAGLAVILTQILALMLVPVGLDNVPAILVFFLVLISKSLSSHLPDAQS
jgi:hypothetical protein